MLLANSNKSSSFFCFDRIDSISVRLLIAIDDGARQPAMEGNQVVFVRNRRSNKGCCAAGDLRERGHLRAGLLRVQLRRVHGVRRQRVAAAARRPGGRHGRHPMLLLRPRALAGPLAGMVRHLLRRLLVINCYLIN